MDSTPSPPLETAAPAVRAEIWWRLAGEIRAFEAPRDIVARGWLCDCRGRMAKKLAIEGSDRRIRDEKAIRRSDGRRPNGLRPPNAVRSEMHRGPSEVALSNLLFLVLADQGPFGADLAVDRGALQR